MRTTFRDLCISSLRISRAVDAEEIPTDNEISQALDQLNGFLEQMMLDGYFSLYKKTVEITPIQSGVYFSKTAVAGQANAGEVQASIQSVLDLGNAIRLVELSEQDFALKNQLGTLHNFYTISQVNPNRYLLKVANGVGKLIITYTPRFEGVSMDSVYEDFYPKSTWGVIEYGLAGILGVIYGQDVTAIAGVYQGRLERLKSANMKPTLLNQSGVKNFDNGWFG